jgi:iron complex transport system ATP-binding protein
MTSLLDARSLTIRGRLQPTSVEAVPGEMIAVIGPNGAGKTSLLRALAGIELDAGDVVIAGERVAQTAPARRMRLLSFLPATRGLVWPISVRDVIGLGLPAPSRERVEELVHLLELDPFANRTVNSLSTGERSRVLFARALAARPHLLLLDEPLSNLDPYWVLRTLQILREVAETGCTIFASIHDLSQVAAFDRALLVNDGRIAADEQPEKILTSPELSDAFRIEWSAGGWTISPAEDRRSSP